MSTRVPLLRRPVLAGVAAVVVIASGLVALSIWTRPVRMSVAAYTQLIGAANRQDLPAARGLCSTRYLETHSLKLASEGGIVGLPRNIHPNFQAWKSGPNVWLCPTNRVGPIYQFVFENRSWRFDGPVGILRGRGDFIPYEEMP